jgi:hypothetical protein
VWRPPYICPMSGCIAAIAGTPKKDLAHPDTSFQAAPVLLGL